MRKVVIATTMAFVLIASLVWAWRRSSDGALKERTGTPADGRLEKTEDEWRQLLTPEQFRVARHKGTERAFSGAYWDSKDEGVYHCVCRGQALFDSAAKFDSGTGWPSYWKPVDENCISLYADHSLFTTRTEVTCSRCDAHLG